jgi:hypothetical protein
MFDSVSFSIRGRFSSTSVCLAGYVFNGLVWHLLGKVVSDRLALGLIDEEVVDVLGCVLIFDVFCDCFGSSQLPSVFSHVDIAIDIWWCGVVIPGVPQSLSSVTAFFGAVNCDGFGSFDLHRKV